jgi:hypothetical protein
VVLRSAAVGVCVFIRNSKRKPTSIATFYHLQESACARKLLRRGGFVAVTKVGFQYACKDNNISWLQVETCLCVVGAPATCFAVRSKVTCLCGSEGVGLLVGS